MEKDDFSNITISDSVTTSEKIVRHRTLEERTFAYNGKLNLDGEFDYSEPVGREVW